MNIYKFRKEEMAKADDDFVKTAFGAKAKVFSMMPMLLACVGFISLIAFVIFDTSDANSNLEMLIFLISTINFSIGCVVQLIYGKLLGDFVKANAKK